MMATDSRRQLSARKLANDLQEGDLVRRKGHRGVGFLEEVRDGYAWVSWKDSRKEYLPLVALRRIRPGGHDFDRRQR